MIDNHAEILASLLKEGVLTDAQVTIYNLFGNPASLEYLKKVRITMFMTPPAALDAQALSFQEGRRDLIREIFETIDVVNYKLKTRGDECPSYLKQPIY